MDKSFYYIYSYDKKREIHGIKKEQAKKKFRGNCYNCRKAGHKVPKEGLIRTRARKFINEEPPMHVTNMSNREKFLIVEAWKQTDFLCKGYILSALEDDLYIYSALNTSKEMGDALEKKYKTEGACLKSLWLPSF
ncbi:hypothetical protein MTR67_013109 [Solanum verrucosum]|uniref:Uncharacterized protein n=1 Tax=Solanum verrucosum TaxID=315347 RepID=A0AAF0Q9V4_SOLVR|nr:hypothetical protein MTR67_013109 [Solanum verrucosum]